MSQMVCLCGGFRVDCCFKQATLHQPHTVLLQDRRGALRVHVPASPCHHCRHRVPLYVCYLSVLLNYSFSPRLSSLCYSLSTEYAVLLMHIHPRLMRRPCIAGLAFVMILMLVLCWNRTDYKKSVENNVRFAMQCKRLWIVTLICESAALVCELSDAPRHVRCQWDRQHADWLCASELRQAR